MIDTLKDTWVLAAEGVTYCRINQQNTQRVQYFFTYRDTGATPTPAQLTDTEIKWDVRSLDINTSESADVWVVCRGGDGRIRVDI